MIQGAPAADQLYGERGGCENTARDGAWSNTQMDLTGKIYIK